MKSGCSDRIEGCEWVVVASSLELQCLLVVLLLCGGGSAEEADKKYVLENVCTAHFQPLVDCMKNPKKPSGYHVSLFKVPQRLLFPENWMNLAFLRKAILCASYQLNSRCTLLMICALSRTDCHRVS